MGEGWVGFGNWDYWKIVLHVVIGDKTDTDVELVVIIQTEQGHSRIKLRKHMTWNSNVQQIGYLGVKVPELTAQYDRYKKK